MAMCTALAEPDPNDLSYGQVYGSAGYLNSDPLGAMVDAPTTVLVFTAKDGHRNLTLAGQAGDYVALLEHGRYCITAYTRAGKRLELAKNQIRCVDVKTGKDVRLDVMLARGGR